MDDDFENIRQVHFLATRDALAEEGGILLQLLGTCRRRREWDAQLRKIKTTARTAVNRIVLFLLRCSAPELFRNLRVLDVPELYRLAWLGPEKAAELYPEACPPGGPRAGSECNEELSWDLIDGFRGAA